MKFLDLRKDADSGVSVFKDAEKRVDGLIELFKDLVPQFRK
ncbi:MAG: hypothetical protein ACE5GI_07405 [Candidatus Aminicenantales bacterium]